MSVTIHVPQPETPARVLKSLEAPGKPKTRLAGGWIADFVALKRAVMLCPFCLPKFNPRKNNYEPWRNDILSTAKCDGCSQPSRYIKTFIHESTHHEVGDPYRRPKRGRWASKGH